jgi:hypothetical protein
MLGASGGATSSFSIFMALDQLFKIAQIFMNPI